jgi:hypothetical protein
MDKDPILTNPDLYRVIMENERVRVLEYGDRPGDRTTPHAHPDSVMVTLSTFRRPLVAGAARRDVEMTAGMANWLGAQEHSGENIGDTVTHVIFVELKEPSPAAPDEPRTLGPT